MSSYAVAPLFVIRAAGVPFEHLERLGTPRTSAAARKLVVALKEYQTAREETENVLRTRSHGLPEELFRAWRTAVRARALPSSVDVVPPVLEVYRDRTIQLKNAEAELQDTLTHDLAAARRALLTSSRSILPDYLIFGTEGFINRLPALLAEVEGNETELPPRNARARERERFLLLYLQRLCAKNDTFAQFGPTLWGTISDSAIPVTFTSDAGQMRKHSFLERWTAHAIAAAINSDSTARAELTPRINPHGRIERDNFVFTDTGEKLGLDSEIKNILDQCDGVTRVCDIAANPELLDILRAETVIRAELEVPALDPNPIDHLLRQVRQWRPGPARERWLPMIERLAALPAEFSAAETTATRAALLEKSFAYLHEIGVVRAGARRTLYSAANTIGEECCRPGSFAISQRMTDELAHDAEPWVDLWRDTYAFVASRVAAGLRRLFETAPVKNGAVDLPRFLQHCTAQKMSLERHGLVALATIAFAEVKTAFREQLSTRTDAAEWQLTADDCHILRRKFEFPKFDGYTFPSADLQISARSREAMQSGDFEWIISELHPPVAMLHHCFYWDCSDPAALSRALASTTFGKPNFHFGFFPADFTSHTTVRIFDALPDLSIFVAPQLGNPNWKTVRPADAEVYVDQNTGDVCLRERDSHEHLGSFARAWLIPLGFHPFHFGRSPHMPRLRCGKVIVQRRSWTVTLEEFGKGDFTGVSPRLIVAVEEVRAARGLPRFVYIRPTEQALRRSGAEGRDKDTKPVYIDLESYLSIEIFYRWLQKAGEVEVTEMLPDPDHLCWQEEDGRRTFELRTLIVPRA